MIKREENGYTLEFEFHDTFEFEIPKAFKTWRAEGLMPKEQKSCIIAKVFLTHEGKCCGAFNPQTRIILVEYDGRKAVRSTTNFDWLLPVSEENEKKLTDEILRRFQKFIDSPEARERIKI